MTHAYQSPTTFCQVTYDSDWFEDDRHFTPYRYSLLRNDTDSNSDTVSLTLPSYTYYEYLKSLYDCRTTATPRHPMGYTTPTAAATFAEYPTRAPTWHAFNRDAGSELSRQAIRSEPTRIRPTYPFPSLHLLQQGDVGDEYEDEIAVADRAKQKLVWVDALNKWVPESQLQPRPYISFIGNAPVIGKPGKTQKETNDDGGGGEEASSQSRACCERYETHMGRRTGGPSVSPDRTQNKQRNNEKRDAIRKRAQELAEQRNQRKAYSTPLYTSLTERKYKARVQSSKVPHSTPVSPISQLHHQQQHQQQQQQMLPHLQNKDRIPVPREVWQPGDGRDKQSHKTEAKPATPARREISITLVTPKPDEQEQEQENLGDGSTDKADKKVTFVEKNKEAKSPEKNKEAKSPKKKKKKDGTDEDDTDSSTHKNDNEANTGSHTGSNTANHTGGLGDTHGEEGSGHQGSLSGKISPDKNGVLRSRLQQEQDRVYEATMNAAAKRRKAKPDASKQKAKSKADKPEKSKKGRKEPEEKQEEKPKHPTPPPPPSPPPPKPKDNTPKEKPVKDVIPEKSKPMLTGVRKPPKPPPAMAPNTTSKRKTEKLPITKPSELEQQLELLPKTPSPEPEEAEVEPKSPYRERLKSIVEQRVIIKKERRERRCSKKEEETVAKLPEINFEARKVDPWIYGQEDYTESLNSDTRVPSVEPLPSLSADLNPEFIESKKEIKEQRRKTVLAKLIATGHEVKRLRKPGQRDSSYQDELRRLELAEERRKKQMEMYERLKKGKLGMFSEGGDDGTPKFEDYGFLSKYCIFTHGNIDMYKHAFDAVDQSGSGWLEGEDVMIALRGANNKLTEAEEEYLYRVLELTGYQITHGADFKMFSVLAALSQKISSLDKWMKNMIGKMDFKQLEMKMFKCKELWECNVDKDTNCITLDQLCVELRAGGVSFDHEMEVRDKLGHMHTLNLLDFLTYVPLFIMIHEAVIENPLDDTRNK